MGSPGEVLGDPLKIPVRGPLAIPLEEMPGGGPIEVSWSAHAESPRVAPGEVRMKGVQCRG